MRQSKESTSAGLCGGESVSHLTLVTLARAIRVTRQTVAGTRYKIEVTQYITQTGKKYRC